MTHYPPVRVDRSRLWVLFATVALLAMCVAGALASIGHAASRPTAPIPHNAPTMAHPSGWPTYERKRP